MEQVQLKAYGKLNLSLGITGLREDGYHLLDMVMQSVSLFDTLTITLTTTKKITLSCSDSSLPTNQDNIAYKAVEAFYKAANEPFLGVTVHIQKHIPHGGGMGGGSADAAGVLQGLNILHNNLFSQSLLCEIGLTLGADVPFCIKGGCFRVQGIGEQLTKIKGLEEICFLIAKPEKSVSTVAAYKAYDQVKDLTVYNNAQLIKAMEKQNVPLALSGMVNALEKAVKLPEIVSLKQQLMNVGAMKALMTGSGSCVFGVFESFSLAQKAKEKLQGQIESLWVVNPVSSGVETFN